LVADAFPVFFDHQPVLEARAAAALHEYAQAAASLVFFGQELVDLRRGRFRHINHGRCSPRANDGARLPSL
jgi:hypothetical protein